MTSALLDTHAFVWAAADPDRLGDTARALIENPETHLLVSAASAWELSTKVRLGRLPEAEFVVASFADIARRLRVAELAVNVTHALRAGALRWEHRDPFDRMLAAQALSLGVSLVSRDTAFAELPGLDVVW